MLRERSFAMTLILKILILSQLCAAFDGWNMPDYGVALTPNNPKACMGDNITMTCTVTDKADFDSSELTITVNKPYIEHSELQIVDEDSATMTFWNLSSSSSSGSGYPKICCKQETETGEGDCQLLQVYDNPVAIENLTCVVSDWSQNMNCTWSRGVKYGVIPAVTFEWRIHHLNCDGWTRCPDLNKDHNYCYWRNTTDGDFSMKVIDIRVNVSAKCGKSVTTYYTLNTKTMVKPAAATDVSSKVLNSTCVQVSWTSTRLEYNKVYRAWYTSVWNTSETKLLEANDTGMHKNNEVEFCDLIPATAYEFHVQAKPGKQFWSSPENNYSKCGDCSKCDNTADVECECLENDGYWSDQRTIAVTTVGDLPGGSPVVSAGGYKWDPSQCEGAGGWRQVSLYWQSLEKILQNGEILGYELRLRSTNTDETRHLAGDTTSIAGISLLCGEDYTVTIQARNKNGTSPHVSSFVILDSRKGIQPPHFLVEMSNTTDDAQQRTVHVEWRHPQLGPDIEGYTVYWCEKDQGECAMGTMPHWLSVEAHVNSTELQLKFPENYLYSVAVDTNKGSSGMTWQNCIYTKDVAPSRQPVNVEAHPGIEDRALYVTWASLTCTSGEPYIDQYIVEYCQGSTCGNQSTKENSIFLRELEADKAYSVRVQGMTMTKNVGPWSDSVEATPIDDSLEDWHIVFIVIGGVFILALCIAGALCIYRKGCKWRRKTFSPRPVDVPIIDNMPEVYENQQFKEDEKVSPTSVTYQPKTDSDGYVRQLSIESGYEEGQVSSPDSSNENGNRFFDQDPIKEEPEENDEEKQKQALQLQQVLQDGYVRATYPGQRVPPDVFELIRRPEPGEVQIGMALASEIGPRQLETETPRSLPEQEHALRIGNGSSESVPPYVLATVGGSSGASTQAEIDVLNGANLHSGNDATTSGLIDNLAFDEDDSLADGAIPSVPEIVGSSGDSYVKVTLDPNAGQRSRQQDNYVGHESVAARSEIASSSIPISDYQTLAVASAETSSEVLPEAHGDEPCASGNTSFDLSQLESDAFDGSTSAEGIILDVPLPQATIEIQGLNNGDEVDVSTVGTAESTDEESNPAGGSSRSSSDVNAYCTVIPGNEARRQDTEESNDGRNDYEEDGVPKFGETVATGTVVFETETSVNASNPSSALYVDSNMGAFDHEASVNDSMPSSAPYLDSDTMAFDHETSVDASIPSSALYVDSDMVAFDHETSVDASIPSSALYVDSDTVAFDHETSVDASNPSSALYVDSNMGAFDHEASVDASIPSSALYVDSDTAVFDHETSVDAVAELGIQASTDVSDNVAERNSAASVGYVTPQAAGMMAPGDENIAQQATYIAQPADVYTTQEDTESFKGQSETPSPLMANISGYVSENLAQKRSPTVSESRSSINDVEMEELSNECNNAPIAVRNARSVNNGYVANTFTNGSNDQTRDLQGKDTAYPGYVSETVSNCAATEPEVEDSFEQYDDDMSTLLSSQSLLPKTDNNKQAHFNAGYVPHQLANNPGNDIHTGVTHVEETNGSLAAADGNIQQDESMGNNNVRLAEQNGYVSPATAAGAITPKAVTSRPMEGNSVQDRATQDTDNGDDARADSDDVQSDILSSLSSSEDRDSSPEIVRADENGNITAQGFDFDDVPSDKDEESKSAFDDIGGDSILSETDPTSEDSLISHNSGTNGYISTQDAEELYNGGNRSMTGEDAMVDLGLTEVGTPLTNTGILESRLPKPIANGYVMHEVIEAQSLS